MLSKKEVKPKKVIAEKAGSLQSMLMESWRKGKVRWDDRKLERIVKQSWFKNLGEFHREWTDTGVRAARATTQERSYIVHISNMQPFLDQRQDQ